MLNLKLEDDTCTEIKTLLADFRRVQVSRFPIDVLTASNSADRICFVDSRFASNVVVHYKRCLAVLETNGRDDKGRKNFVLRSRLITNPKYSEHNDDYHSRETTDLKKMAKFLREYVKPYSPQEIMGMGGDIANDYYDWKQEAATQFRQVVSRLSSTDIAEEVAYLKSVGVQFRSEKFMEVATTGLELFAEAKRRGTTGIVNAHVYIHPDNSVSVSIPEGKTYSYESLEGTPECVRQQVAMLMMVDMNQYVPEVGKRTKEKMFWVHVNTDTFNDSNT